MDQSVPFLPVSVHILWISSFRSHPGSPAAPVLPGPHSSSCQGEGLPSLRLDLAVRGASAPEVSPSPGCLAVPGAGSVV